MPDGKGSDRARSGRDTLLIYSVQALLDARVTLWVTTNGYIVSPDILPPSCLDKVALAAKRLVTSKGLPLFLHLSLLL